MGDAAKISDPLLLIHGMSDDNVVFENSTAFAAKMQATQSPFEMMFYPGKTHAAGPRHPCLDDDLRLPRPDGEEPQMTLAAPRAHRGA